MTTMDISNSQNHNMNASDAAKGIKWGNTAPLEVRDPVYNIVVPLRAFGLLSVEALPASSVKSEDYPSYFRRNIQEHLAKIITEKLTKDGLSVLQITAIIVPLTEFARKKLSEVFSRDGLTLTDFKIIRISPHQSDPKYAELLKAAIRPTTPKPEPKPAPVPTPMPAPQPAPAPQPEPTPASVPAPKPAPAPVPPPPSAPKPAPAPIPQPVVPSVKYFLAINGQRQGPFSQEDVIDKIVEGDIGANVLVWKSGMPQWAAICSVSEFSVFF